MHYPKAEVYSSTLTRWNGVEERRDGRPYEVELYSDSDWASCKVTRRSTSSGLIFVSSCCVHSYSRAQMSISLSSMEAEILAATSLLVEGIQVKQLLQFLLGDGGGLSNNAQVQMGLKIGSNKCPEFLQPPWTCGRAKHLSTRLLWSQQAMRKRWFLLERISTKENFADLNTKPLSRERREYLMKKIGLMSETFAEDNDKDKIKVKQIVRLVTAMVLSGNLQGCDGSSTMMVWLDPMPWTSMAWWTLTTIVLVGVVSYLVNKVNKLNVQLAKHKEVWDAIRTTVNLQDHQDPFVQELLPDARRDPFSGVWYERESHEDDGLVNADNNGEALDREAEPHPPRIFLRDGTHGAADGDGGDEPSEPGEAPSGEHGAHSLTDVPNTAEGIEIMTEALAEIMDGAGEHVHVPANVESEDDWIDEQRSIPKACQGQGQEMVHLLLRALLYQGQRQRRWLINVIVDSLDIAVYYGVGMVPREYAAFEDFRWGLIMQGMGPETILVHHCRELSHFISSCTNPMDRGRLQRLLRSLHSLLVMFQSKNPNLWIDAVDNVKRWLEADGDWNFFEIGSIEGGSRHEEGEAENGSEVDESIDPQDRRPIPDDDDGDGRGPGDAATSSSRPTSWDYDT
eukprot:s1981_g15.t1